MVSGMARSHSQWWLLNFGVIPIAVTIFSVHFITR